MRPAALNVDSCKEERKRWNSERTVQGYKDGRNAVALTMKVGALNERLEDARASGRRRQSVFYKKTMTETKEEKNDVGKQTKCDTMTMTERVRESGTSKTDKSGQELKEVVRRADERSVCLRLRLGSAKGGIRDAMIQERQAKVCQWQFRGRRARNCPWKGGERTI